jgi:hypothetical protein
MGVEKIDTQRTARKQSSPDWKSAFDKLHQRHMEMDRQRMIIGDNKRITRIVLARIFDRGR